METKTFKTKNWNNRIYIKEELTLTQEEINKAPLLHKNSKAGDKRIVDRSGYIEKSGDYNNRSYKIVKALKDDKKIYELIIANCDIRAWDKLKQEFINDNVKYIIHFDCFNS
jgi:hypothetical protein